MTSRRIDLLNPAEVAAALGLRPARLVGRGFGYTLFQPLAPGRANSAMGHAAEITRRAEALGIEARVTGASEDLEDDPQSEERLAVIHFRLGYPESPLAGRVACPKVPVVGYRDTWAEELLGGYPPPACSPFEHSQYREALLRLAETALPESWERAADIRAFQLQMRRLSDALRQAAPTLQFIPAGFQLVTDEDAVRAFWLEHNTLRFHGLLVMRRQTPERDIGEAWGFFGRWRPEENLWAFPAILSAQP